MKKTGILGSFMLRNNTKLISDVNINYESPQNIEYSSSESGNKSNEK